MSQPRKKRVPAAVWWVMLACVSALVLLVGALVIPILTHSSAGGSGQHVPEGFVPEVSATGADGRTRTLSVTTGGGAPADLAQLIPGEELIVSGTGFDSRIGMYLAICAVPSIAGEKPGPCLGGIPDTEEGAKTTATSVWITDDWAWRAFASQGYQDPATGSFSATLTVPAPDSNGLDCRNVLCAVTTRADHTAATDRVQDIQLPVAYSG